MISFSRLELDVVIFQPLHQAHYLYYIYKVLGLPETVENLGPELSQSGALSNHIKISKQNTFNFKYKVLRVP